MKPPVLSDEEVFTIIFNCKGTCEDAWREVNEAQRDADAAYYEPLIEAARQDTAREIFEELDDSLTELIPNVPDMLVIERGFYEACRDRILDASKVQQEYIPRIEDLTPDMQSQYLLRKIEDEGVIP